MELREYIKIIFKHWKAFWLIVILATVGTYLFTKMQPQAYLASTTLTVNKSSVLKQSQVNYYLFDNYYNVQSSGLFSQIVTSWFESPAVVKEIYTEAGVTLPEVSQGKLAKIFKAVRAEPATINVSYVGSDKVEAEKLVDAAADIMQEKTNEMGKSDRESVYDIVRFAPIVTDSTPNILLSTIIGLIAGIIFGIIVALGINYFKAGKKS